MFNSLTISEFPRKGSRKRTNSCTIFNQDRDQQLSNRQRLIKTSQPQRLVVFLQHNHGVTTTMVLKRPILPMDQKQNRHPIVHTSPSRFTYLHPHRILRSQQVALETLKTWKMMHRLLHRLPYNSVHSCSLQLFSAYPNAPTVSTNLKSLLIYYHNACNVTNCLKIISWNIRSSNLTRIAEIRTLIEQTKPHIVCLQEAFANHNTKIYIPNTNLHN